LPTNAVRRIESLYEGGWHADCAGGDDDVNIHESGQLGLAVAGEQVSLLPLAEAATPTAAPKRSDAGPTIFEGQASLDV
jgi:hypothetical protein